MGAVGISHRPLRCVELKLSLKALKVLKLILAFLIKASGSLKIFIYDMICLVLLAETGE